MLLTSPSKTFNNWFCEENYNFHQRSTEATQECWNVAIDKAVEKITNCEIVNPEILRIRLHEAVGAVLSLKIKGI